MCPLVGVLSARGMPILLASGAVALLIVERRRPSLPGAATWLAFGSLILIAAASALWSVEPETSLLQSLQLLGIAIPGLLLIGVLADASPDRGRSQMVWLPVGVATAAGMLLVDLLADFPIYRLLNALPAGHEIEPYVHNKAATAVAVLLFPAWSVLAESAGGDRRPTISRSALVIAASAGILVTPSQSAMVALAAGLCAVLAARARERMVRGAITILAVGGAISAPFAALLLPEGSSGLVDPVSYSAAHRIEIWRLAGELVLEHPLLGIGMEGARHALTVREGLREGALHPHNLFLQIWLELGLVGVVWLVGFLLYVHVRIGRMAIALRPFADATFAAALLVSCFAWGFWQSWWLSTLVVTAALFALQQRAYDGG